MFSFIIPCKNQGDFLDKTLSALSKQLAHSEIEIIVIDNASEDDTVNIAKSHNAQLLSYHSDDNPFAARNLGIKSAKNDVIVLLDAKCIPNETYVPTLAQYLNDQTWDILGGEVVPVGIDKNSDFYSLAYSTLFLITDPSYFRGTPSAITGNMVVRKRAFKKIGLFKEIRSGQDTAFVAAARNARLNVVYAPDLRVYYKAKNRMEFKSFLKHTARNGLAKISFLDLRPPRPWRIFKRLRSLNIDLGPARKLQFYFFIWKIRFLRYYYQNTSH